jgi:hypothetical protein
VGSGGGYLRAAYSHISLQGVIYMILTFLKGLKVYYIQVVKPRNGDAAVIPELGCWS